MVGVSTYDGHAYCRNEFVKRLKEIVPAEDVYIIYNGNDAWGFDDFKMDMHEVSGKLRGLDVMVAKQNMIRKHFLKKGSYSHLLMLESDNIPPKDVVKRLLKHKKDIVSSIYFIKSMQTAVHHIKPELKKLLIAEHKKKGSLGLSPYVDIALVMRQAPIPSAWGIFQSSIFGNAGRLWSTDDYIHFKTEGLSLIPIISAGVGCVLISRKILSEIPFRARDESDPYQQFSDFLFYTEAIKNGYQPYMDIDTLVKHIHIHYTDDYNTEKWFDTKTYRGLS